MPNPLSREEQIFNAALELPSEQRAAYLDQACAGDPALRQRVEALLGAHARAGGFLKEPAVTRAANGIVPTLSPTEKPGDRIGRYKILQQIGEGGCGVVYMAEQEEPVRRRVALKVIKLGMDTKQVIARFEAERQALALMEHPHIAKVLDAGATETGRPFFVMELVRGVPITQYCDQNNLSTRERLSLFTQVCQAIQHAHQKGIIHRDIKPSNVLITVNDGVPVPKVIDFGIAKATQGRLTDQTLFTAFEQFIGTPAYMSPEQAEMTSLDIDTRSDIYSLGVLLYELLTGQTPFDAKELLAAGLEEMRRTIREREPVRPSTRLSTMLGDELTTTAKCRHTDAPKLIHLLRGDLDWIVMKALEKDRTRRYETANGLAVDIQRHLNNEPVVARPPSNLYRFQKLVRRNQLAFAAASVVTVALVIGLGVSTWMFFKEKAARQRAVAAEREQVRLRQQAEADEKKAQTEAARSEQTAQFLKDMLNGVDPSVALGRDTTMLREILDKTAERLSNDLRDQPDVEAELRNIIGDVYWAIGRYDQAEAMHRRALALRRKLFGDIYPDVAESLDNLAEALRRQGRLVEAETTEREALVMRRKLFGDNHQAVAKSLDQLGLVLFNQGRLREAEAMQRETLAVRRKLFSNEHSDIASSLSHLGFTLHCEGKWVEAEATHREALSMRKKLLGNEHPRVASSLDMLAIALRNQGKLAEAETTQREALALSKKLYGSEHPEVARSLTHLGTTLQARGELAEAEPFFREGLAMNRKLCGNENPDVGYAAGYLASLLRDEGKLVEAETFSREALAIVRKKVGDDHPDLPEFILDLVDILVKNGKPAEARPLAEEAVALYRRHPDWPARSRERALGRLSALLGKLAEFDKAEAEKKADAPQR